MHKILSFCTQDVQYVIHSNLRVRSCKHWVLRLICSRIPVISNLCYRKLWIWHTHTVQKSNVHLQTIPLYSLDISNFVSCQGVFLCFYIVCSYQTCILYWRQIMHEGGFICKDFQTCPLHYHCCCCGQYWTCAERW